MHLHLLELKDLYNAFCWETLNVHITFGLSRYRTFVWKKTPQGTVKKELHPVRPLPLYVYSVDSLVQWMPLLYALPLHGFSSVRQVHFNTVLIFICLQTHPLKQPSFPEVSINCKTEVSFTLICACYDDSVYWLSHFFGAAYSISLGTLISV